MSERLLGEHEDENLRVRMSGITREDVDNMADRMTTTDKWASLRRRLEGFTGPVATRSEQIALLAERDELLEALKRYVAGHPCSSTNGACPTLNEANAAIARAEGDTP